jgi:hypothetical protein
MTMLARICRLGAACAFVLTAFAFPPGAAHAGPAADQVAEAEALIEAGDSDDAMVLFDTAVDTFWEELPLHLRNTLFVSSVEAFGQYEPRAATFRPGETVTVYIEPVGYGFVSAAGFYRAAFSTALQIRTPGGLILAESEDFGKLAWAGRARSREIPLTVSVTLPGLSPGDYELSLTLTDDASGDTATGTLSFAVAE